MAAIENPMRWADRENERILVGPADASAGDAAITQSPADDAAADLGARFAHELEGIAGRNPSTDALFEVPQLEALDWGVDRHVKIKPIR